MFILLQDGVCRLDKSRQHGFPATQIYLYPKLSAVNGQK